MLDGSGRVICRASCLASLTFTRAGVVEVPTRMRVDVGVGGRPQLLEPGGCVGALVSGVTAPAVSGGGRPNLSCGSANNS